MYEKRYDKLETLCISPECSILEAIKVLDETHERIVLIVEDRKLLGVLTVMSEN